MEITNGKNELAGLAPRCPKCGYGDLDIESSAVHACYVECSNCGFDAEIEKVSDFTQFFGSPAPKKDSELYLHGHATDNIWLMDSGPESRPIGVRMDCGDSGVVYLSRSQAVDLAEQLNHFAAPTPPLDVEAAAEQFFKVLTVEVCCECGEPRFPQKQQAGDETKLGWPACVNDKCVAYGEQKASSAYRCPISEQQREEIFSLLRRHIASPAQPEKRDARQKEVSEWCAAAFGMDQCSVPQRGIRMLEEAIEAYQSATVCLPAEDMRMKAHVLVDYVMNRLAGNLAQECGGVGLTLLALCQSAGISAEAEELREIARVKSKPLEHFHARNQVKNEAGFELAAAPQSGKEGQ